MASYDDDYEGDDLEAAEDPDPPSGPVLDGSNAIVLFPREPFRTWVRQLPEHEPQDEELLTGPPTIYLVPPVDRAELATAWLLANYQHLFAFELEAWSTDESQWPVERSFGTFKTWFEFAFCSDVVDCTHIESPELDCPPISPAHVVDALEALSEDAELFIDTASGSLVTLTPEQILAARSAREPDLDRPEEWRAAVGRARQAFDTGTYVMVDPLPEEDFQLREAFATSVQVPPSVRNRLLDSLQGRRADRRFHDTVDRCGLRPRWREFRRDVAMETMRAWLVAMRIPTTEHGD